MDMETQDSILFRLRLSPNVPGEVFITMNEDFQSQLKNHKATKPVSFSIVYQGEPSNSPASIFANELSVYPVPAQDYLTFSASFNEPQQVIVKLFDTHGKELISQDLGRVVQIQQSLAVEHFPAGIYLLQLHVNGTVFHKNVIIGE